MKINDKRPKITYLRKIVKRDGKVIYDSKTMGKEKKTDLIIDNNKDNPEMSDMEKMIKRAEDNQDKRSYRIALRITKLQYIIINAIFLIISLYKSIMADINTSGFSLGLIEETSQLKYQSNVLTTFVLLYSFFFSFYPILVNFCAKKISPDIASPERFKKADSEKGTFSLAIFTYSHGMIFILTMIISSIPISPILMFFANTLGCLGIVYSVYCKIKYILSQ